MKLTPTPEGGRRYNPTMQRFIRCHELLYLEVVLEIYSTKNIHISLPEQERFKLEQVLFEFKNCREGKTSHYFTFCKELLDKVADEGEEKI